MKYDSISVDGESFEYDRDLNFDDEKIEKLNGILFAQDSKMNETDDLLDHEPSTPSRYGPDFWKTDLEILGFTTKSRCF